MSSDAQTEKSTKDPATLTEALLGAEFVNGALARRLSSWPAALRIALAAMMLATAVFVPYLGAVGLWDPWETHYGEVAREMMQRNDYVHPWWESAWFYSKPAFTMWMQALGMQAAAGGALLALVLGAALGGTGYWLFFVKGKKGEAPVAEFWGATLGFAGAVAVALALWGLTVRLPWKFAGVTGGDGALPLFLEWGFRLPFAGFSIIAVALLAYAMARLVSPRAGLATAVVLCTMPLYFLLSRQAVTDTPFVSATIAGMACALVGLLDKESKHSSEWWYAAWAFFALGTLAKGWLAFLIPGAVGAAYAVLFLFEWAQLKSYFSWLLRVMSLPLAAAAGAFVVVGAVAYFWASAQGTMFISGPPRVSGGLPGQGNDVLQAAHWLALTWGLLAAWVAATATAWMPLSKEKQPAPAFLQLGLDMRLGTGMLLFLLIALPWYYEMFTTWRLDDEGKLFWFRFVVHDHLSRFFSGVHTTTPGGTFTYFIEQGGYAIFPWVLLLPGAVSMVGRARIRGATPRDVVAVLSVVWVAVAWFAVGGSATKFHHYVFPMLPPVAMLIGIFLDRLWEEGVDAHLAVLLMGVPLFLLVGKDLYTTPKNFTDLFVYNYDRPYPEFLVTRPVMGTNSIKDVMRLGILFFGGLCLLFALARAKAAMFTSGLVGVMVFALWFNWSHWVDLSHNWTQRDQFWRYYTQKKPGEPIASFLMNWRGETFYSRDTVKQIKDNANVGMAAYAAQPGRKWSLVEHARLGILKGAVGAKPVTVIDNTTNNKFVLVTIGE